MQSSIEGVGGCMECVIGGACHSTSYRRDCQPILDAWVHLNMELSMNLPLLANS